MNTRQMHGPFTRAVCTNKDQWSEYFRIEYGRGKANRLAAMVVNSEENNWKLRCKGCNAVYCSHIEFLQNQLDRGLVVTAIK